MMRFNLKFSLFNSHFEKFSSNIFRTHVQGPFSIERNSFSRILSTPLYISNDVDPNVQIIDETYHTIQINSFTLITACCIQVKNVKNYVLNIEYCNFTSCFGPELPNNKYDSTEDYSSFPFACVLYSTNSNIYIRNIEVTDCVSKVPIEWNSQKDQIYCINIQNSLGRTILDNIYVSSYQRLIELPNELYSATMDHICS